MAARDDLVVSTRQLMLLLINGRSPWEGLQIPLNDRFGPSLPNATQVEVQERYKFDPETQGLRKIATPLNPSLVTITVLNRQRESLFKQDRHPTRDGAAWVRRYNLQLDVWAATPVLVDNISDALEEIVTASRKQLWDAHGIGLNLDDFQDAPLEIESGIYRAFARGYCTVAAFTA